MTGGHYLFVNTSRLAQDTGLRRDALMEVASKLRYTLGGFWALIVDVPVYSGHDTSAIALKPGVNYTLRGLVRMKGNNNQLYNQDETIPFAWGFPNKDVAGEGSYDSRLPLHKPCTKDTDCGAGAGTDPCGLRCDIAGSRRCEPPAQGARCQDGDGICCGGQCVVGEDATKGVACRDGVCTCDDPDDPMACP